MKKIFLLIFIMAFYMSNAQERGKKLNTKQRQKIEQIKNDTTYYWGQSEICSSDDDAEEGSMDQLIENIAENCKPNAIYLSNDIEQKEQLKNIIKTFEYCINEKTNTIQLIANIDDEEFCSFKYIKRSDFKVMCDERKSDIKRFAREGLKAEDDCNVQLQDALKFYYWGLMLCYAHPYGRLLKISVDGNNVDYEWLIQRIDGDDGILNSFTFIIPKDKGIKKNDDGILVPLRVYSKSGMPVSNLSYSYNNGRKKRDETVRDGVTFVQLVDEDKESFNIKINYEFKDEAKAYKSDVYNAINLIEPLKFKHLNHEIDLSKVTSAKKEEKMVKKIDPAKDAELANVDNEIKVLETNYNVNEDIYLSKMHLIESAFRERNYEKARNCFSEEGFGMIDTLVKYGKLTVVGSPDYKFLKFNDEVICRSIRMQFDFRNNAGFNRDVVFRFDTINKVVTSIAFRLTDIAEKDIIKKSEWSSDSRMTLINFLEDYQTAYALKRLDYLTKIYSDDALIIVGHVVKKTKIPDKDKMVFNLSDKDIRLMEYDKAQYFKNLSMVFKAQEYINLRFTDTDFSKAQCRNDDNENIYGVRLRQEYYSSTYGDVGYLFLLVDLRNILKPIIHVRAWQPDKVDLEELMQLKDIRIN